MENQGQYGKLDWLIKSWVAYLRNQTGNRGTAGIQRSNREIIKMKYIMLFYIYIY